MQVGATTLPAKRIAKNCLILIFATAPGAATFNRGYGTGLATQQTLAALPGAASTNTDNAGYGSGSSYSSGGYAAYGTGETAQSAPGEDGLHTHRPDKDAGLKYVQPSSRIAQGGADAASKTLGQTNQMADAAGFPHCDGNSCSSHNDSSVTQGLFADPVSGMVGWVVYDPDSPPAGLTLLAASGDIYIGTGVHTAANTYQPPKVLVDAIRATQEEVDNVLMAAIIEAMQPAG